MKHPTEEALALHYYDGAGEGESIEQHLRICTHCASEYARLTELLTSIVPPEAPEIDGRFALQIVEHVLERVPSLAQPRLPVPHSWLSSVARTLGGLAPAVWLAPLLYPLSFLAIFRGAQLSRAHPVLAVPAVLMALAWALAGPFVAVLVLRQLRRRPVRDAQQRLVMYGALTATISPALYNLISRAGGGLPLWYVSMAVLASAAALPLSPSTMSTARLRLAHRLSASLLVIFGAAHIANHLFAFVSLSAHTVVLDALRVVYRERIVETLIIAAVLLQIGSGAALLWHKHLRQSSVSINLQALSGLYLAAFFLAHVSAVLLARPTENTDFVWASGQFGLLASPGAAAVLPYYLSGIAALFVHLGYPLHSRAMTRLPALTVRRLSYAVAACGGAVVMVIGLALCGFRMIP